MLPSIAHYQLLDRMGEGALGEVYRARDNKVGRTVAIKLAPDSAFANEAERAQFLDEARVSALLSHPNITTLFDVGEYEGGSYLAYEFASGVTLRQEMAGRAVNPRRAVELAVQIADALAEVHAQGLIHGDLRPDTIFVTKKGSAKVLDVGMSRWTRGGRIRARAAVAPDSVTADQITVVSYMSPEQALGDAVDARTDIFSLGVILYEMLNGRNPFAASSAAQTVLNVVSSATPSLPESGATADLPAVVARAMAKALDKRHQSAVSFAAELRRIGAALDVRAGDSVSHDRLEMDHERSRAGLWWAIAGAVLVAGLAYWAMR
jgi:eukaryotic-like serine/threonine-protein kinase